MNFERRFLRLDFIFEVQKSRSRICSFTLKVKKLERLLRKKVQFKLFHFLIVCINAYWQNLENSPKKFPKIYFFQKSGISKKQVIRFQPNENFKYGCAAFSLQSVEFSAFHITSHMQSKIPNYKNNLF